MKTFDSRFLSVQSEIGEAFKLLGQDPDCRVIIFSGNGKAFCAGIDLNDLMALGSLVNSDEDTARKSMKLFNVIKTFQKQISSGVGIISTLLFGDTEGKNFATSKFEAQTFMRKNENWALNA